MDANEAIKTMLATTGVSQAALSKEMGGSDVAGNGKVGNLLRSAIKANTLAWIADILGYDLMLHRRGSSDTIRIEYNPSFESKRSKK